MSECLQFAAHSRRGAAQGTGHSLRTRFDSLAVGVPVAQRVLVARSHRMRRGFVRGVWLPTHAARLPPLQIVNSILISPDGKMIATLRGEDTYWNQGGKPLNLEIWSVRKGTLLWKSKERAFSLFAFSPDSTRWVGIAEPCLIVFHALKIPNIHCRCRQGCVDPAIPKFELYPPAPKNAS